MSRLWRPVSHHPDPARVGFAESLLACTVLLAAAWAVIALVYWLSF